MNTITERMSKFMFTYKELDKKLIEKIKSHLGKPLLTLALSWYDGFDLNKVNCIRIRIPICSSAEYVNNIVNSLFSKISIEYIMVLVDVTWFETCDGKSNHMRNTILQYQIPTYGYRFDKSTFRWVKK